MSSQALIPVSESLIGTSFEAANEGAALLSRAVIVLDELRQAHPQDWAGLARLLVLVRELKGQIAVLEKSTKGDLVKSLPERYNDVEGVGMVEKTSGRKRDEWDDDAIDQAIVRTSAVDMETGEMRDGFYAASLAVDLTRQIWGGKVPKVTKLPLVGIDADGVSEWVAGEADVKL